MSEYFQALKRLDRQRPEEPRLTRLSSAKRPVPETAPPTQPLPVPGAAPQVAEAAPSPHTAVALSTLLDNLRALTSGHPSCTLVFAGASEVESARTVVASLTDQAERLGLTVAMAELAVSNGQPLLRQHRDAKATTGDTPLELNLRNPAGSSEAATWLTNRSGGADLILIEAPPLSASLDAVLLARTCDGLVIVAEAEVTKREALRHAADRARGAGCRTLGIVMHGTKQRLPDWLRELLGDHHFVLAEAENQ